jgi:hypothetical protein
LPFTQSAIGFQFLLDAIEGNQPYKIEIIRWITDNFPSEFPNGAKERQIALFLRKHLGPQLNSREAAGKCSTCLAAEYQLSNYSFLATSILGSFRT